MTITQRLVPISLRGYQKSWLAPDIIGGLTLAAVAIPEVMGYTSITQTPIATGLYTILLPLAAFVLFGASRQLVVGGDSATAAILAAGLLAAALPGVAPESAEWVSLCAVTALLTGLLLVLARLFKLGFLGDFLSAPVLIGFLGGVGIQVAVAQIPSILGVPKGSGNWFQQQWAWMSNLGSTSLPTLAYGLVTIVLILGFKRFLPKVPGAIIAVIGLLIVATVTDAAGNGVDVVGAIEGGLPHITLPTGLTAAEWSAALGTALACFFIVISQSAATSRSFAMKSGERADVNRDIVGLAAANIAAGLTGTFVVNGSPTKTRILDEAKGRTQVANLVVVIATLLVLLFLTNLLTDLPHAVLGGIVFVVGIGLVEIKGLRRIAARRRSEFFVALITLLTVFLVSVTAGILVAIALSLLDVIARQYRAPSHVLTPADGGYDYLEATAGVQTRPGLIVYRFDSPLFFANASGFADHLETVVAGAPDPVRWVILDCAGIDDIDYSASQSLLDVIAFLHARDIHLALARPEPSLLDTFRTEDIYAQLHEDHIFGDLDVAIKAFDSATA